MLTLLKISTSLLLALLVGCSSAPLPEALDDLEIAFETSDYYFFESKNNDDGLCYLFYPGGRIKPEAYAPYTKKLAENGVHVFLLRPLFEMALFNTGVADKAKNSAQAESYCNSFFIGGHSFGGIATATYAAEDPSYPLLIIGSYIHQDGLENYPHPVTLIYGSEDLLVVDHVNENKNKNPPQTVYRPIKGGNHALMGYYGVQDGDGVATISREEQQRQLLAMTLEFIDAWRN